MVEWMIDLIGYLSIKFKKKIFLVKDFVILLFIASDEGTCSVKP